MFRAVFQWLQQSQRHKLGSCLMARKHILIRVPFLSPFLFSFIPLFVVYVALSLLPYSVFIILTYFSPLKFLLLNVQNILSYLSSLGVFITSLLNN